MVKCRTKEAREMVEQFETYVLGLQLFDDNVVYNCTESGRLLDKTYRIYVFGPGISSTELLINESKGKFESATLSVLINDLDQKKIKKDLIRYGIGTYSFGYSGKLIIPVPDAEKLYSLIIFLKEGIE